MLIYITLTSKQSSFFGQALLGWMFRGGGWKPKETTHTKRLVKDDKLRLELFNILKDMKLGIYSSETEKAFKKIGLPINFSVDNIAKAYTIQGEPEQLIVSGNGDASRLVKWLEQKQIKHEVRDVRNQELL